MKKKLNGPGFREKCRGCPTYTANAGGYCKECLDVGMPDRPKVPSDPDVLRAARAIARRQARAVAEVLANNDRPSVHVPAAVARGRGLRWEAFHS